MFEYYNHLGFQNPYFIRKGNSILIQRNLSQILKLKDSENQLDIISVIQVLNRNYMLGDRTIIKNVNKTPWMAKPNRELTSWLFDKAPAHGEVVMRDEEIAEKFFHLIQDEIMQYIGDRKNIGVLLSGGMDSRIVAGTISYLIKKGKLKNVSVTSLTWGLESSRDVQYAKSISNVLGWKWKHYVVGVDELRQNIEVAAARGCEYSPIHLHAMPQISLEECDCILAGSYGDSIGRGEYSKKKVIHLKSLSHDFINVGSIVRNEIYNDYKDDLNNDINSYRKLFPKPIDYQQNEQDYQLHYMRRMLNACMSVINEKIPLYQVFTSNDILSFVWSLSPECRNDNIYKIILKNFDEELQNIPWARTGLPYGTSGGKPDNLSKRHHNYQEIISGELLPYIEDSIFNGSLVKLGIFNHISLKAICKLSSLRKSESNRVFTERLIWLASLSKCLDQYDIKSSIAVKQSFSDYINGLVIAPKSVFTAIIKKELLKIMRK